MPMKNNDYDGLVEKYKDRLLTYKELSVILAVSVSTLRRWKKNGVIPFITIAGGGVRFYLPAVIKSLQEKNIKMRKG